MKTKYIVIRTRHYEVIRFFEGQKHGAKPVKVYYEDGLWAMKFHIKARTKLEERAITFLLTDKTRRIEKAASP